jgi:hypothetical protein
MKKEQSQHRRLSRIGEAYNLTENEDLFDRMTGKRLVAILDDEQTTIHEISNDSNNYGEFLFVATSRIKDNERIFVTFYGLGFHEHRDRWYTDEWHWYEANSLPAREAKQMTKQEAHQLIEERRADIAPYINQEPQSKRGVLFEMLADLTDEDGAYSEMEDLGDLADLLGGDDV